MQVWVVVKCSDAGEVVGVFSSEDEASKYIAKHAYEGYIITVHTVDKV